MAEKSLFRVAGIVAVATLLSKGMGFLRQVLIASLFGSGPAYSAFSIAYVLPGFLLILLGGINGPFHSAIVSIFKKREGEAINQWLDSITTGVSLLLMMVTGILILGADRIVQLIAPGSSPEVHRMAAEQLRIMSPLAVLAGLIGIGFGSLNARNQFLLPSISPVLSSLMVILALMFWGTHPNLLAWGTLAGALAQWLAQIPFQIHFNLGGLRPRFNWSHPEVKAVGLLMIPAVISSGMVHINVYVDLFFASFIPGDRTIGNLTYAQLLVQTPLGILSNMLLVPLMPLFSRLALPPLWPEFRQRIQQSFIITSMGVFPCSMLLIVFAQPIVQLAYQRGEFTLETTQEVAALLAAYGSGMVAYLLRDVLVRIFYAMEDGQTPLQVSLLAIFLNVALDYLGIHLFGAPGLAFATVGVNIIALAILCLTLHRKLGGISWSTIGTIISLLTLITTISGFVSWSFWSVSEYVLSLFFDPNYFWVKCLRLTVSSTLSVALFLIGVLLVPSPEIQEGWQQIQDKIAAKLRRS
jgi:putative peptidoglycan lipid II flippase